MGACAALPLMSLGAMGENSVRGLPSAIVFAELVGLSGIAAATLDLVLGDIDAFPFGFVDFGSKLPMVRSGKWSTEPESVVLADWPFALPMNAIWCPIPLHAPNSGTNSPQQAESACTSPRPLEDQAHHEKLSATKPGPGSKRSNFWCLKLPKP